MELSTISSALSNAFEMFFDSYFLSVWVITLLVFIFVKRRFVYSKSTIPIPWNFPIVGSLPWIGWSLYRSGTPLYEFMRQLKDIYGNIYAFNFCGQLVVVVNEFQAIKKVLDSPYVNARPQIRNLGLQYLGSHNGLVLGSGDIWSQQRKFTQTAFRSFGIGLKSFEEKIALESRALITEIARLKGDVFESQPVLVNAVSNVICSVIFGNRFDYRDEKFLYFQMLAGQQTVLGQKSFPEVYLPFLRNRKSEITRAIEKNNLELRNFVSDIIREHQVDFDPNHPRDYIDVYLNELQQKKDGTTNFTKLDEESMKHTITQLFSAGTDTTSGTLQWGLAYMVAYPEVQTRIQEEIDAVVGRNRLPKLSDKPSLPYTCATIFEIQRLTRSRLAVPHLCTKSVSVCGVTIPVDAIVMANIWAVHRDPELYSDPEVFNPERFLNEKGEVYQPEEFIPFSTGRRICLGDKLARMELYIFLSHIHSQRSLLMIGNLLILE
ncbi:cytochrome P450 2J5-like [Amphiura filiformis]|uniref:cytochrome P450 2J5-like n=1 Tax=Amphiura filiformis TaxID=82378 RepID=UPI003B21C3A5